MTLVPPGKLSPSHRDYAAVRSELAKCRTAADADNLDALQKARAAEPAEKEARYVTDISNALRDVPKRKSVLEIGAQVGWLLLSCMAAVFSQLLGICFVGMIGSSGGGSTTERATSDGGVLVVTAMAMQHVVQVLVNNFGDGIKKIWQQRRSVPLQKLRALHAEQRAKDPPTCSNVLAQCLREIDGDIEALVFEMQTDSLAAAAKTLQKLTAAFCRRDRVNSLASQPAARDISNTSTELSTEDRAEMQTRLAAVLADYPEHSQELRILADSIRSCSSNNPDIRRRAHVYLTGPAGTGKTTFVRRLGAALGKYVCVVPGSAVGDVEKLLGKRVYYKTGELFSPARMGCIGEAYIEAGSDDFILLLDEAGDSFGDSDCLAQLKYFTDAGTKQVYSQGLSGCLDFSRVTIVATGNVAMRNPALLRRMHVFEFSRLNELQKAVAFRNGFETAVLVHSRSGAPPELLKKATADIAAEAFGMYEELLVVPGSSAVDEILFEVFAFWMDFLQRNKPHTASACVLREFFTKTSSSRMFAAVENSQQAEQAKKVVAVSPVVENSQQRRRWSRCRARAVAFFKLKPGLKIKTESKL